MEFPDEPPRPEPRALARRIGSTLAASAPGLALLTVYGFRIAGLRADPSGSPGTPGETVIALLVAGFALASFVFARAVFAGGLSSLLRVFGVIALTAWAAGLCFGVLVMAS